jgi:hypothetical protein
MSKTDAIETDILNLFVGKATTIFVTTVITPYIGLHTVVPSDSTAGTEATGSSYARQSVVAASWTLSATAPTQAANNVAVTFPVVTTTPYTVVGAGLFNAVSAGNLLRWAATTSTALAVGDQGNFAISAIVFTED